MTEQVDVRSTMQEARTQTRAAARSMFGLARALMLAGIGAAALTKDETAAFVNRLIERGTVAESNTVKAMEDMTGRTRARSRMERQVEGTLNRMNIPTRSDLASLEAKITVLSAKIDTVLGQTPPPATPGSKDISL